jgi:hypothetical protein
MMLVGWFSDLPAIASSGEAGGIAQETISYHYVSENCLKRINRLFTNYLPKQKLTVNSSFNPPKAKYFNNTGVIGFPAP